MSDIRAALFADSMQVFQIGECSYTFTFFNPFSGESIAIRIQKNVFDTAFAHRAILPYDSVEKIKSEEKEPPNLST